MITIYAKNGTAKCQARKLTLSEEFMGVAKMVVDIASPEPIDFAIDDYIDYSYNSRRYLLKDLAKVKKQARRNTYGEAFVYTCTFYEQTWELENCPFLDLVPAQQTAVYSSLPDVTVYAKPQNIVERVQANLDSFYGENEWEVLIPNYITDPTVLKLLDTYKDISLSQATCKGALDEIYKQWGLSWIFVTAYGRKQIYVAFAGDISNLFKYGKGQGLRAITVEQKDTASLATRIYPYGSTENLPARWYNEHPLDSDPKYIDEFQYIPHLMLPPSLWHGGTPDGNYVEDADAIAKYGLRPKTIYFEGGEYEKIMPSISGLTAKDIRDAKTETGDTENVPSTTLYPDATRMDRTLTGDSTMDNGVKPSDSGSSDDTETFSFDAAAKEITIVNSENGGPVTSFSGDEVTYVDKMFFPLDTVSLSKIAQYIISFNSGSVSLSLSSTTTALLDRFSITPLICAYAPNISTEVEILAEGTPLAMPSGGEAWSPSESLAHLFADAEAILKVYQSQMDDLPFSAQLYLGFVIDYKFATAAQATFEIPVTINLSAGEGESVRGVTQIANRFTVKIKQIGFDIMGCKQSANENRQLNMKSGLCAGYSFNILKTQYNASDDSWTLTCYRTTDTDLKIAFPNTDRHIMPEDEFVLTGIEMPDIYVYAAMEKLYEQALLTLAELSKPKMVYAPEIDNQKMAASPQVLHAGMLLQTEDTDLDIPALLPVDSLQITEDGEKLRQYSVTLRNEKADSLLRQIVTIAHNEQGVSERQVSTAINQALGNYTSNQENEQGGGASGSSSISFQPQGTGNAITEIVESTPGLYIAKKEKTFVDLLSEQIVTGKKYLSSLLISALLAIPTVTPSPDSADANRSFLWCDTAGNYAETPSGGGGGTGDIYALTFTVNNTSVVYNPSVEAKTISLTIPTALSDLTDDSTHRLVTDTQISNWGTAYTNNHTHSNKSVLDGITSTLVSNWSTAYTNSHTHSNKSVLDGITSTKTGNWDTAYTNSHTHSNKSVLDGITSTLVQNWNDAASLTDVQSGSYLKNDGDDHLALDTDALSDWLSDNNYINDAGPAAFKDYTTSVTSGSGKLVTSGGVYTALQSYQPLDADLTAIAGLTGTSGFLKKTITTGREGEEVTWSIDTSTYLTSVAFSDLTAHPTTLSGYGITDAKIETPSGTSNRKITLGSNDFTIYSWALASSKPSYNFSEIGSKPTTISGYGITDAIPYGDIIETQNSWLQKRLYLDAVDNALWAADQRYNVLVEDGSGNAVTVSNKNIFFDGDYEGQFSIPAGETRVIRIQGKDGGYLFAPGYPYGWLHISFYNDLVPDSIAMRVYCNYASQGVGWKTLTMTNVARVSGSTVRGVYEASNNYYNISEIELTIVAPSSKAISVTEICYYLSRGKLAYQAIVSKAIPETLYYDLTAPKFVATATTGTAPLTISSTTLVSNLNADLLDGLHSHEQRRLNNAQVPTGTNSFAGGYNAQASGDYSVALGRSSVSSGENSFATGNSSYATGGYSIAMGRNAYARRDYSVALNGYSVAGLDSGNTTYPYATLAEYQPKAITYGGSTVYGIINKYDSASSVTFTYSGTSYTVNWPSATPAGYRALVVVEITSEIHTPTTGEPWRRFFIRTTRYHALNGTWGQVTELTTGIYALVTASLGTSDLIPTNFAMTSTAVRVALWKMQATAIGNGGVATGYYGYATGNNTGAFGSYSTASGTAAVTLNNYSVASGAYSTSLGYYAVAAGSNSLALGSNSMAAGNYSITTGFYSVGGAAYAVATGYYARAMHSNSLVTAVGGVSGMNAQTVIGQYNTATNSDALIFGWGTDDSTRKNIMTVSTAGVLNMASNILPMTTNTADLGSSTLKFKDIWSAGTIYADGAISVPTSTPSSPDSGRSYLWCDTTGNYAVMPTYTFNQLVENGDFSNGTTGWTRYSTSYTTFAASGNVCTVTLTGTQRQPLIYRTISCANTHKIYWAHTIRITCASPHQFRTGRLYTPNQYFQSSAFSTNDFTNWKRCSGILTMTSAKTRIYVGFYGQASTDELVAGDKVELKDIMLCDLTEMYGAGNEPTKEQFEALYPADYYEYQPLGS